MENVFFFKKNEFATFKNPGGDGLSTDTGGGSGDGETK